LEILFSEPINEQKKILRIRSNLYSAMKQETADILDVTVPPANIGRLIDAVDEIARKHGVSLPTYGHAGDGNLHIHIMREREQGEDYIRELRNEVYTAGLSLDGVITGEHGIGRTRLGTINQFFDNRQIQLMKGIKQVFDPNGILNPEVKIPI
jgi:glycolate oxidase